MRLVRLTDTHGNLLYMNPEHVTMVAAADKSNTMTTVWLLEQEPFEVKGDVQEVAGKLQWADAGRP